MSDSRRTSFVNEIKHVRAIVQGSGVAYRIKWGLRFIMWDKIAGQPFYRLVLPSIITRFNGHRPRDGTLDSVIDFGDSFSYLGVTIRPMQIREEIRQLLEVLDRLKPRNLLEIGTAFGGTLYLFSRIASDDAKIISVNRNNLLNGGYVGWKFGFFKSFAQKAQSILLVEGDSHRQVTLNRVRECLNGEKLDFLFIDGDHTYEGIKQDFEWYSPLVRKGGIIAIHDIVDNLSPNFGVNRFWKAVRENYDHRELVRDWQQGWGGIGVLEMP